MEKSKRKLTHRERRALLAVAVLEGLVVLEGQPAVELLSLPGWRMQAPGCAVGAGFRWVGVGVSCGGGKGISGTGKATQ